ncbi:TetR/AcrR family transcriptional regulator [Lentilactobacillus otakiensis]|uniref:TetR/AcrR family transcriptional regulator n=1 Tax=Lentilactobacillus otakiensis TaxID=481720 RepID=UPI003D179A3D
MASTTIQSFYSEDIDSTKDLPQKQKQVLKACLELFASKGFEATTTADIADKAGVSQGTVYKRFKTKEQLLQAVVQPLFSKTIPRAAKEFSEDLNQFKYDSLADFLRPTLKNRLTFATENKQIIKILFMQAANDPQLLSELVIPVKRVLTTTIPNVIDKLKERHLLVDWDTSRILEYVLSIGAGFGAQIILFDRKFDLDTAIDQAVEFLVKGLSPEK